MNKRVKIVATLGPAVEIRGGKKFGEDGYWGEKLDVEASAKNIAQLIEAGANTFRFNFSHGDHQEQGERMATVKLAEKLAGKKLVSFLIQKDQKSVQNCSKVKLKSIHTKLVRKSVLQLNKESNQLVK